MPKIETLERFIARVEQNAHAEAVEEFYTTDSSMQENQASPRVGRKAHIAAERGLLSKVKTLTSECVRPVFLNGDIVVIRWIFRFEWLDGTVTHMEELAYQRWDGERIAQETFFYDPAQRVPKHLDPLQSDECEHFSLTKMYSLKSKWQRGPRADLQAPVLVSATRFTFRRLWYMPIVLWHGMRLRHAWGTTPGAVGVSLAVDMLKRTTYTVSVWENPQQLHRWLHSPYHSELMRRYRQRVESSSAATWKTDQFVLRDAWEEAARRLSNS